MLDMEENKNTYEKPVLEEIGDAKSILKNVFTSGTGDTFPGTEDALATS